MFDAGQVRRAELQGRKVIAAPKTRQSLLSGEPDNRLCEFSAQITFAGDFPANILCSPDNKMFDAGKSAGPNSGAQSDCCAEQLGRACCQGSIFGVEQCSPDNRLCRVFGAAITLRPCNSALRTFRRRTSYAPLTTGSAEFSAQQSLCAPAIRPCGLSGVEHLMLP